LRLQLVRTFDAPSPLGWLLLVALSLSVADASPRQKLSGHIPEAVNRLSLTGTALPPTQRLNLAIGLPLRNEQELDALLTQLYDPSSPNYHRYLTPEQFTVRFGPTEHDYQSLINFAKANGLTVTVTHPNRVLLDVQGSVEDIQKTFHVTLRTYRHPREAREFYAPDAEPSVDFAVPILHISGLDNYSLPHPDLKVMPHGVGTVTPNDGSGPGGTYRGYDFRTAYVPGTTLTGTGQSVGLVEFDGFYTNDISTYASQAGLPNVPLTVVPVDGGIATPGTNSDEVSLDIEMAISMAPGLDRVYVYEAPPNVNLWVDLLNRMASDNLAKQLSSSWGGGLNPNPAAEQIFKQMGAQGQSFFNASGDSDAFTEPIAFPSDSPNITMVGGTTLTMNGTGASYQSETVWNRHNGDGSSGGISTFYSIPPYQQGISMAVNQGSTTMRNVPDVAMTAEDIHVVFGNGKTETVGGTSAAAPLWGAFTALVNQQAQAAGLQPVGFLNPALYAIGSNPNYIVPFHDITTGDNTWFGSPNRFFGVPGYDLCTGWGTPGSNLINILTVIRPPWIYSQPQSQTVAAGASASFRVVAKGMTPFHYQWLFNGQPIGTATNSTYSIARVQSIQVGTYTVVVGNSYGSVASDPATLAIAAGTGAFGVVGVPFSYQITADNNPKRYTASALPSGLHFDPTFGVISGTPSTAGTYPVFVQAINNYGAASTTIVITIKEGEITSGDSIGVVGALFFYQIAADNHPIRYTTSALPSGLHFDPTFGLISGTPSTAGIFPIAVQAINNSGAASATIVIAIEEGEISSGDANGIVGAPFFYQITADNEPIRYTASALPSGLHFDPTFGEISGTPSRSGTFPVAVQAINYNGTAFATIVITIKDGTISGGTTSQPTLTISRSGDNVLLAWPPGFTLEETQLQQNTWTTSSASVVVQGNQATVLVPIQSTAKFYRLRK
jgi:hypothetical protein